MGLPAKNSENYKPNIVPKALKTLYGGLEMSDNQQELIKTSKSPIQNKLGNVFIPVTDIEESRDWYCKILGITAECEIMNGHLCPLPMDGPGVILDTMPMWGGKEPGGPPRLKTPAFMFMTENIQASYDFVKENDVTVVTDIENGHWFVIKDPDDNMLMICS
jgi:catechol 2,3-dioxygenase-like lactoylglutathione lyase family enzyme